MKKALIALLLFVVGFASAQIPKPLKNTYVNDFAGVLSKQQEIALNKKIFVLEKNKKTQLAIVLVNKIPAAYDIEEYAVLIGKKWHVGKNQRGIVYVAAIKQHKQRLEVARNLAPTFTGEKSMAILDDLKPDFRANNYSGGLLTLVQDIDDAIVTPEMQQAQQARDRDELAAAHKAEAEAARIQREEDAKTNSQIKWTFIIGFSLVGLWVIIRLISSRGRQAVQQYDDGPNYRGRVYSNGEYSGSYSNRRSSSGSRTGAFLGGAALGAAAGYGARMLQDHLAEDKRREAEHQQRIIDQPIREEDPEPEENEPKNWGNWGGGSSSSDSSSYDSGFSYDSGSSDSGSSDSGSSSSSSGATSDW